VGCQLPPGDPEGRAVRGAAAAAAAAVVMGAALPRPATLVHLHLRDPLQVELSSSLVPAGDDALAGCDVLLPGLPGEVIGLDCAGGAVSVREGEGAVQALVTPPSSAEEAVRVAATAFIPLSRSGAAPKLDGGPGAEGALGRALLPPSGGGRGQLQLGRLGGRLLPLSTCVLDVGMHAWLCFSARG
jgi:hypothetical protein